MPFSAEHETRDLAVGHIATGLVLLGAIVAVGVIGYMLAGWPVVDPALLVEDSVTCVVQIQGKVRDRLEVSPDISEADLREQALALPGVVSALEGRGIKTVIVRAPKLVNIVPE